MDSKLEALIDIAIQKEEDAFRFYSKLADQVADDASRETLRYVAEEEKKHKAFLVDYRTGRIATDALRLSEVTYYRIAEHQEEPEVSDSLKREDVFLLAAHRENRSYFFYTELADLHPDGTAKEMLLRMANEELKHKEKMEYLYTNAAFPQTDGG